MIHFDDLLDPDFLRFFQEFIKESLLKQQIVKCP